MGDEEEVTQRFQGKDYTLPALHQALLGTRGKAKPGSFWSYLKPVVEEGAVKLQCIKCGHNLTCSNPSQTASKHFKDNYASCVGLVPAQAAAAAAAVPPPKRQRTEQEEEEEEESDGEGGTVGPLDAHLVRVPKTAAAKAVEHLGRFFFCNNVALQLVDDPHLKAAFGAVGVPLPTRKTLSTVHLDAEASRVQAQAQQQIDNLQLIQVASDGWKRKAAAQGTNLINFMVLPASGGSLFYKLEKAGGVIKDTQYVKTLHLDILNVLTGGNMERALGCIMDNTKTNRAAMREMKELHPDLIFLGCQVIFVGQLL
jgi:hypothetical protein